MWIRVNDQILMEFHAPTNNLCSLNFCIYYPFRDNFKVGIEMHFNCRKQSLAFFAPCEQKIKPKYCFIYVRKINIALVCIHLIIPFIFWLLYIKGQSKSEPELNQQQQQKKNKNYKKKQKSIEKQQWRWIRKVLIIKINSIVICHLVRLACINRTRELTQKKKYHKIKEE